MLTSSKCLSKKNIVLFPRTIELYSYLFREEKLQPNSIRFFTETKGVFVERNVQTASKMAKTN
jgi:hypothetical protein